MRADFDTPVDRRGSGSLKWDVGPDELPMWVADMDFPAPPAVVEALCRRAAQGVYGYAALTDDWYDAYIGWWRARHGWTIERDWLVYASGVVPILSSVVRKLTTPAEKVVLLTPVYPIFFNCIRNNGRVPLECPLRYRDGAYEIDFDDLARKLADPQSALLLLCNPHNPTGNLWDRGTLARIGALARQNGVIVVSDEIHCDLTAPGSDYVPFLSASEDCRAAGLSCLAPTKTFNLAGLQTAAAVVPDPHLRHRVWRALNTDEVGEPNAFAVTAAVAAFTSGAPWLDALRAYLAENRRHAETALAARLPRLVPVPSRATYLAWLDGSALFDDAAAAAARLREKTGLVLSDGTPFGGNGARFLRMNLACPRSVLCDGLDRLCRGFDET